MGTNDPTPPARPGSEADIRQVARNTRDISDTAHSTLARLDALSREVRTSLARQDAVLASQDNRIAELGEHVAGVDGKLDILIELAAEQRRENSAIRVVEAEAVAKIETTDKIEKIKERRDRRRFWRSVAIKILAGAATVWAAIATAMAGQCGS